MRPCASRSKTFSTQRKPPRFWACPIARPWRPTADGTRTSPNPGSAREPAFSGCGLTSRRGHAQGRSRDRHRRMSSSPGIAVVHGTHPPARRISPGGNTTVASLAPCRQGGGRMTTRFGAGPHSPSGSSRRTPRTGPPRCSATPRSAGHLHVALELPTRKVGRAASVRRLVQRLAKPVVSRGSDRDPKHKHVIRFVSQPTRTMSRTSTSCRLARRYCRSADAHRCLSGQSSRMPQPSHSPAG